jgi:hypothetical protein
MPWQRANPTVNQAKARWTLRNRFPSFLRNNPVPKVTSTELRAHIPNGCTTEKSEIPGLDSFPRALPSSAKVVFDKQNSANNRTNTVFVVTETPTIRIFMEPPHSISTTIHYPRAFPAWPVPVDYRSWPFHNIIETQAVSAER